MESRKQSPACLSVRVFASTCVCLCHTDRKNPPCEAMESRRLRHKKGRSECEVTHASAAADTRGGADLPTRRPLLTRMLVWLWDPALSCPVHEHPPPHHHQRGRVTSSHGVRTVDLKGSDSFTNSGPVLTAQTSIYRLHTVTVETGALTRPPPPPHSDVTTSADLRFLISPTNHQRLTEEDIWNVVQRQEPSTTTTNRRPHVKLIWQRRRFSR